MSITLAGVAPFSPRVSAPIAPTGPLAATGPPVGVHAVVKVCAWCSARAQRLEMALWAPLPRALVLALRGAGATSDGICPDCARGERRKHGQPPMPEVVSAYAKTALPDAHPEDAPLLVGAVHVRPGDLPFAACGACLRRFRG